MSGSYKLPDRTAVIARQVGDGFTLRVLPETLGEGDILITPKRMGQQYVSYGLRCDTSTPELVRKLDSSKYNRVVLHCRLPNIATKLSKNLATFCKDKVVLIVDSGLQRGFQINAVPILESCAILNDNLMIQHFDSFKIEQH